MADAPRQSSASDHHIIMIMIILMHENHTAVHLCQRLIVQSPVVWPQHHHNGKLKCVSMRMGGRAAAADLAADNGFPLSILNCSLTILIHCSSKAGTHEMDGCAILIEFQNFPLIS